MTDRKQALTDLLEKVDAGDHDGLCFAMARNGWPSEPFPPDFASRIDAAYQGSLDAAKAMHEAVLPRHYAQVHMWPMPEMCRVDIGGGHTGRDDNPARAWLIAIIKALIAKEGDT